MFMNRPSKIVRTIASITFPFIVVFGLYVVMHGHLTPGGGFQGGAVVASGFALLVVAFGTREVVRKIKEKHLSILESLGALAFISLAFAGITVTFFYNSLAGSGGLFGEIPKYGSNPGNMNTGGFLPLMNLSVGLKVIAGLSAVVLALALISLKGGEEK